MLLWEWGSKLWILCPAGTEASWTFTFLLRNPWLQWIPKWFSMNFSLKPYKRFPTSISAPRSMHKVIANKSSQQPLYLNSHSGIAHERWKLPRCPSTAEWKNKTWPSRTGILFSHEQERSADTCHSLKGPWKHDAKGKKPDTKDHMSYDSMYMKYPKSVNP